MSGSDDDDDERSSSSSDDDATESSSDEGSGDSSSEEDEDEGNYIPLPHVSTSTWSMLAPVLDSPDRVGCTRAAGLKREGAPTSSYSHWVEPVVQGQWIRMSSEACFVHAIERRSKKPGISNGKPAYVPTSSNAQVLVLRVLCFHSYHHSLFYISSFCSWRLPTANFAACLRAR